MVSEAKRAAIKRCYRLLRTAAGKTQDDVTALARLDSGRFWKFENGRAFPTPEERRAIARVLRTDESNIPAEHQTAEAHAS